MENFNFDIGNKSIPSIRLTGTGFVFNKASIELLGSPEYICMALDVDNKKVGIKAIAQREGSNCYKFVSSEKKTCRISITATKIYKSVLAISGVKPYKNTIIYTLEFDSEKNILILDMSNYSLQIR